MNRPIGVLVFLTVLPSQSHAQVPNLSILLKGGLSLYNEVGFAPSGDTRWKTGFIFGAGAQLAITEDWSLQALFEYSTHAYKPYSFEILANEPRNTITEFIGNVKRRFGVFFLQAGVGISHQQRDDVIEIGFGGWQEHKGQRDTRVIANFGLGFEMQVFGNFNLLAEFNFRDRQYVSELIQAGLAYQL